MLNYTTLEMLISDKHSNLLGPFVTYEENNVFVNITPWVVFATLNFLRNL
jgi:hypothetical protein